MVPFAVLTTLSLLGYHLTFDAEMTTQPDMSQFINTFQNGDTRLYGNLEAENYVPYDVTNPAQPYVFNGGTLTFNATPVPAGDVPYTSGMVETYGIFQQSRGYFEIRAAMPAGQGFWPAFWLLPNTYYPEIDILEQPNNSGTDTDYWTHTSTPTVSTGGFTNTGVNVFQGYHTYGFLWQNGTIQYVFDGSMVGDPQPEPAGLVGLDMYMIANLAVGGQGSWPGVPLTGASSSYSIDYIRAFSNDPAMPAVAQQPISSPDGANTTPVLVPPTPATPKAIGAGPDTLILQMSEDAYQGDAQFTVTVDGTQIGGTQTTTGNHSQGQTQAFTVHGRFRTLKHTVTVNFLNDANGPLGDRNLYVTGASVNGTPITNVNLALLGDGPQSFNFWDAATAPVSYGTGPDTFVFGISQLPVSQNAHYSIYVDGKLLVSRIAAPALRSYGQSQVVKLAGNFGPTSHTVEVSVVNTPAAGATGSPTSLSIDSLSYDGVVVPNSAAIVASPGAVQLQTPVQQADTLTVAMTEDAYQGDAVAQINVDGVPVQTQTVTAANSAGTPQTLTLQGNWGGATVAHSVVVNYLNDLYVAPGSDRNLHVQSVQFDGTTLNTFPTNMMIGGPATFSYVPPAATGWTPVTSAKKAAAK